MCGVLFANDLQKGSSFKCWDPDVEEVTPNRSVCVRNCFRKRHELSASIHECHAAAGPPGSSSS